MNTPDNTEKLQTGARRWATAVGLISTLFAAWNMYSAVTDLLGINPFFALFVAGFLELTLITCALYARVHLAMGRTAYTSMALTWLFSLISGGIAATHQLVTANGIHITGGTILAALVCLFPPVTAALLWHFVLLADKHVHSGRTIRDIQTDRALLAVATASQRLARAQDAGNHKHTLRADDALLRANNRLLRLMSADDNLETARDRWVKLVGEAPTLAIKSRQASQLTTPETTTITETTPETTQLHHPTPIGQLLPTGDLSNLPLLNTTSWQTVEPHITDQPETTNTQPETSADEPETTETNESNLVASCDVSTDEWRRLTEERLRPVVQDNPELTKEELLLVARARGIVISASTADRYLKKFRPAEHRTELQIVSA